LFYEKSDWTKRVSNVSQALRGCGPCSENENPAILWAAKKEYGISARFMNGWPGDRSGEKLYINLKGIMKYNSYNNYRFVCLFCQT
jgi:hypothetical protein